MDKMKKVKKKKKNGKKIDPPPLGLKPQIFERNFPAQNSGDNSLAVTQIFIFILN